MAALPYMQLYVAEYLADTAHLNAAQHGGYLLLLMNYWQRGKALKNDDGRLAIVARMTPEEWAANRAVLEEFFTVTETEWIHNRVEIDLALVTGKSEKARAAGRASGKGRIVTNEQTPSERSTDAEHPLEQAEADADRTSNHTDTYTDKNRAEKTRARREPRAAFVLPDWVPIEPWRAYLEVRRKKKAPETDYALSLVVRQLDKLRASGQDPGATLNKSIRCGWTYFF
jgi:uncharacterized protein YdaU (DUF1376 family)